MVESRPERVVGVDRTPRHWFTGPSLSMYPFLGEDKTVGRATEDAGRPTPTDDRQTEDPLPGQETGRVNSEKELPVVKWDRCCLVWTVATRPGDGNLQQGLSRGVESKVSDLRSRQASLESVKKESKRRRSKRFGKLSRAGPCCEETSLREKK